MLDSPSSPHNKLRDWEVTNYLEQLSKMWLAQGQETDWAKLDRIMSIREIKLKQAVTELEGIGKPVEITMRVMCSRGTAHQRQTHSINFSASKF